MRVLAAIGFGLLLSVPLSAQAPPASPKPDAALAELMRGIMFPNANILFDVTTNDPGIERPLGEAGGGALKTFANIYVGWDVVKNAALVIGEATDLILKPGRLCVNGRPVPLANPDFLKAVQNLREVAGKAAVAARAQDRAKFDDLANELSDACVSCHQIYRTAPPEHERRCVPGPPPR
jgi:hypothetical protein